jgi:copper chaperone CopZ
MKRLIVLALVSLITLGASAQKAASKNEQTVTIQTNGVCQKCADKFKENVPYFKGVKSYSYDMKTAKLTINYDAKKTNPDQLRQEISKLGYNADNVKADAAARAKLPACCRVEKSGCGGCSGHGNGQGCGNHGNGQGCGNHGNAQKSCSGHSNGQGCGNHGDAQKSCGNHGNGQGCGNHTDQKK